MWNRRWEIFPVEKSSNAARCKCSHYDKQESAHSSPRMRSFRNNGLLKSCWKDWLFCDGKVIFQIKGIISSNSQQLDAISTVY